MVLTEDFEVWLERLTSDQQDAVVARVDLLKVHGPSLGRPIVDSIHQSRHHNMKELRVSKEGALRALFVFDPLRRAVLLVGGDKSGQWERWYRDAIPAADLMYDEYLAQLRDEGLIP